MLHAIIPSGEVKAMLKGLTKIIGGDPVRRLLDEYRELVDEINALEPALEAISDEELRAKTDHFRKRLRTGEALDDILVEAFAVVRQVAIRTIGLRHFDVQLVGGIVLHEGKIAEMKTGEGKTLVATMPIYLNALEGNGVHLVTVNDYLARRDARWMGPVFHYLGLSVGVLQEAARTEHGRKAFIYDPALESVQEDVHQLRMVDRKLAYAADITYGTNNEFGFDYLRDNMARNLVARSQRGHNYAILDEVDNILIDEARTPLIISGPSHEDPEQYQKMAQVVRQLNPEDYEVSERDRNIALTELGEDHVEQVLGAQIRDPDRPEDITPEQARLLGHLEQALRAEHLFKRNKDYVVQGGRVIIVDEFTGRMMAGRRWSDGLHQAVEAKEGVRVRQENVTYATITLQNYFRMYSKLAGMTGTAVTEAEEFSKIYNVDVIPLPTNLEYVAMQPDTDLVEVPYSENGNKFSYFARTDDDEQEPVFWRRKDYPDVVYRTEDAKLRAVTTEILRRHVLGQPLLVGTTSVELSERLSSRLRAESLQTLMNVLVIRDAYFEEHGLHDDGMRISELDPLNKTLTELKSSDLRPFAQELDLALNPMKPENLNRLLAILELEEQDREKLEATLKAGIKHNVLNAKKHDEESAIIAWAGSLGAVTIATNMAGRGVDIKLGGEIAEEILAAVHRVLRRIGVEDPENMNMEERLAALEEADEEAIGIYGSEISQLRNFMEDAHRVREVGGLHVVGSERHDSRRIDNQLRGRAARQGDAGSSQFFLSMEDELMRLFGGSQVGNLMQRLNIDDAVPIAHNIVNRTIEQAQTRVEGANFDTRKHLLEYDDVLNQQREVFYSQRDRIFVKGDLSQDLNEMLLAEVAEHVAIASADPEGRWKLLAWLEETQPTLGLESEEPYPSYMLAILLDQLEDTKSTDQVKSALLEISRGSLEENKDHLLRTVDEQLTRAIERLEDQSSSRVETAEIAVEAAILEAEETGGTVDPRQLLNVVEQAAGLRIQMENAGLQAIQEDPHRFLRRIPELVETSMGIRIWAGLVQTLERRIGESLGLQPSAGGEINWDKAGDELQEALGEAWDRRTNALLTEIENDLNLALSRVESLTKQEKLRLLVQMSYGQRSFFDRKTHQRQSVLVSRLSYPYYTANLISSQDDETLTSDVYNHLEGAQVILESALGRAEFQRVAGSTFEQLDERVREHLETTLTEPMTKTLTQGGALQDQSEEIQREVSRALGNQNLARTYRELFLSVADREWVEYLTQMEALRTSIGLEAYGQRDPLVQYKSRAFDLFGSLFNTIRAGVVSRMFRLRAAAPATAGMGVAPAQAGAQPTSAGTPDKTGKRKRRRRRRK
jgi:preprotein translocase subunit SecA